MGAGGSHGDRGRPRRGHGAAARELDRDRDDLLRCAGAPADNRRAPSGRPADLVTSDRPVSGVPAHELAAPAHPPRGRDQIMQPLDCHLLGRLPRLAFRANGGQSIMLTRRI